MAIGSITKSGQKLRLGEHLLSDGLLDEQQLRLALERQRQTGAFLGETLVALGLLSSGILGRYLEAVTGVSYIDLTDFPINLETARSVSEQIARRRKLLPVGNLGDTIQVAMADPLDLAAVDDLRVWLNCRIVPVLALESDLNDAINRVFDVQHKALSVLDEMADAPRQEPDLSVDELVGLAEDAPIVRLVNSIVSSAIASRSSDIHIEPKQKSVRVRFRQDGLLWEQMVIPRNHLAAVVSRIKIMSRLNIAERRRPQDGRCSVKDELGREYDLRVSIVPQIHGEKVVMRVLEKSNAFAVLEKLGFLAEQKTLFESFLRRPHGMLLVTGPTGSGKSTTLYSSLNRLNDSTRNIHTIEDPVEYHIENVNQVQVDPKIGVSFATGLRTLVRQDPDIIMVGEIRDSETAEIAIQAALTGHFVLSTLHTNDAPGALVRLQHMGVEPFLVSSAVVGVVAQRLVRTVCGFCKEMQPPSASVVEALGLAAEGGHIPLIASGRGCTKCGNRGMKGRTAVYEIMPMTEALREMVLRRASSAALRTQAIREGMLTLRDAGIRKVMEGETTPDEVARILLNEE